jgi:hypothetical protein
MLPELRKVGLKHPFFFRWESVVKNLTGSKESFGREIKVGCHWYFQYINLVPKSKRIRIYTINIDELKKLRNLCAKI